MSDEVLFVKMKFCAFADEASPQISGQIAALKRNGFDYLEIRGVPCILRSPWFEL